MNSDLQYDREKKEYNAMYVFRSLSKFEMLKNLFGVTDQASKLCTLINLSKPVQNCERFNS